MNKRKEKIRRITAYMFLIWAAFGLSGCIGRSGTNTQMYLEAKVKDGSAEPDSARMAPDSGSGENPGAGSGESSDQEQGRVRESGEISGQSQASGEASAQPEDAGTCFVFVCGAVKRPGVYELQQGSRVYEAIALAGGLLKNAYEKGINQAQQIHDGDMIEVLTMDEYKELGAAAPAMDGQGKPGESVGQAADGLIDINTADAAQLMTLNGIGEAKAAGIIAYREENGSFSSIEEIKNVSGIGEGVYAKIKDKIKVTK